MSDNSETNLITTNWDNSQDLNAELEKRAAENRDLQPRELVTERPLDRWPTLFEILNKKTQTPVDIWDFYEFMRDEQRSINYLDFWIDSVEHLNKCKVYVLGLRESIINNSRERHSKNLQQYNDTTNSGAEISMVGKPRPFSNASDYSNQSSSKDSRSSSMLLDLLMKTNMLEAHDHHRLSTFLRGENSIRSNDPLLNFKIDELKRKSRILEDITIDTTQEDRQSSIRASRINPEMVETLIESDIHENKKPLSETRLVTRADLRESSKRLYERYFDPASVKYIVVPDALALEVHNAIVGQGRDDPEVFDAAKEYVFKAMEYDAYPKFLRTHALRNVTPKSVIFRLIGSSLCALAGFWAAFYMIFYDSVKSNRGALVVPFFFMSYLFFSAYYSVDPILSFFGLGESRSESMGVIKWKEEYAKKLILKRSFFILLVICLVTAAFSVLFGLVPGYHLRH